MAEQDLDSQILQELQTIHEHILRIRDAETRYANSSQLFDEAMKYFIELYELKEQLNGKIDALNTNVHNRISDWEGENQGKLEFWDQEFVRIKTMLNQDFLPMANSISSQNETVANRLDALNQELEQIKQKQSSTLFFFNIGWFVMLILFVGLVFYVFRR